MTRKPIVAGQFYSDNDKKLTKQIESCFLSELGPGTLPQKRSPKKILGCITPHAGYQFSGPCAAFSFKEIAESKLPSTFIVIGPNHSGYGSEVSTLPEDFETPLGKVKTDRQFIKSLTAKCDFVTEDYLSNEHEHSIEVQLPFLQFACKDSKNLKFVPIVLATYDINILEKLGKSLASINKDICVIASSDFTHYGHNYGYMPFKKNVKENIYKLDKEAIKRALALDATAFLSYVKEHGATICGAAPIAALIFAAKALGPKKASLLKYYTSADITKDYSTAVGYASVTFE